MRLTVTQLAAAATDPEFRAALRKDPRAKPARRFPTHSNNGRASLQGKRFHLLADRFVDWLKTNRAADGLTEPQALWSALYDRFAAKPLSSLTAKQRSPDAIQLSLALRAFAERLGAVWQRVPKAKSWNAVYLDQEYLLTEIELIDDALTVSGRIDAIRMGDSGNLELVDYKLNQGSRLDTDLIQLAIYARLMLDSSHQLKLNGVLEYYEPELHLLEVSHERLIALFDDQVRPLIDELLKPPEDESASETDPDQSDASDSEPPQPEEREITETSEPELPRPQHADAIEQTFAAFKLGVTVTGSQTGPQLIRYHISPNPGVKIASLQNRAVDLQVHLGSPTVPTVSPGIGCVYLDLPRDTPETVYWRDLYGGLAAEALATRVAFPIGVEIDGTPLIGDFSESNTCHSLIAGVSGSGKSEFLKAVVATLIARNTPKQLRLSVIDPKILTFGALRGSPFLESEVITDLAGSLDRLATAVDEMDQRYAQLADEGFENLAQRIKAGQDDMPYHIIIFDEFADLILTGSSERKEFEEKVARIAGKGRAAGIHLMLATQRPDRQVVSGLIKANLPLKICLRVTSVINSQIVLGAPGGETLLGRGDLICDAGQGLQRAQSPFLTQDELRILARAK
ncbi:MAG: DNA translocase FtsK [Verrucomicrobiota bacterium]